MQRRLLRPKVSATRIGKFLRRVVVIYLVVVLVFSWLETFLVYPIPPVAEGNWTVNSKSFEEVRFNALDGVALHGFYFPHPQAKRSILYCHGNGEDVSHNVADMEFLCERFVANVLIFDYRGYGHSAGSPHEAGLVADGRAASRFLAERVGCKTSDLILVGRSLGGGVAVAIAAEEGAKALILENTFSRMVDAGASLYPWLPVKLVMRNRYDSLARIAQYPGPVFQSHGDADEIIPLRFAQELFAAIPSPQKKFFLIPQGQHNTPQPRTYYDELEKFLEGN